MNTKLNAQLFGLGLLLTATACGGRTSLMQDDAGAADAGEQTSSVKTSSGGRGGSGTTTGRAGSQATAGRTGASAGSAARPGRGQAGGAATAGKGGAGGKPAAEGGDKNKGGAGGAGGAGQGDKGDQGEMGGEKAPEPGGQGGQGGQGDQGGQGGEGGQAEQGGAGGEQAGAGGEGTAGAPAAGSGGTTAGGALSMLSPDQKTALCTRVSDGTRDQSLTDAIRGYCASIGLRQPEMCSTIRDTCFDGPAVLPVCADTVPECPNITQDEFVSCRIDQIKKFVAYNSVITCDNPSSVPSGTGDPASCVGPYERCPDLRSLER